jgi:hypothetical protein
MSAIYWIVMGGLVGFYCGWKRMGESTSRAREIINSFPIHTADEWYVRAYALGCADSQRAAVALASCLAGAVLGAALWGAASALERMLH